MKDRLKMIRKECGLTQAAFSEALGVTRTAYAKYENGLVAPSDTFIQLLCSKFSINEEWLRTGAGNMHIPTDDSLLDDVAAKFKLSPQQKEMVKIIMNFPDDVRQDLAVALLSVCRELSNKKERGPSADPDESRRQAIERELAAERLSKKETS
ncbi:helix-turn-helix transcriptional regulator [uncultured Dialister sp.]|uniref:helix-turn-helix transcriptional regulator n=1 Tax=uncultured Dialister sp. TaxID=278064 RepID=UPI00259A3FFC|nr:helix-turn-helix transcriptional regulator [uncultured Dialister sp.]